MINWFKKKKWVDIQKFIDLNIRHIWVLCSNKKITGIQYANWLLNVIDEWRKVKGIKTETDEKGE